jgi:hypothetical protein
MDESILGIGAINLGEMLKSRTTIAAHYGLKESEFEQIFKNIICDFVQMSSKSEVTDKNFPKLMPEEKARVLAFGLAFYSFKKMGMD